MARRKTSRKLTEVELGKAMVEYLESSGWDVYQEVPLRGIIADIVMVKGPIVGVVEMKTSVTMTLLGQARRWQPYANLVWIAIPRVADYAYDGAKWVCNSVGLGLFGVYPPGNYAEVRGNPTRVIEDIHPTFYRKGVDTSKLRDTLRPEHKTYAAAGSPTGRVWTPLKATSKELRELVQSWSPAQRRLKAHQASLPKGLDCQGVHDTEH